MKKAFGNRAGRFLIAASFGLYFAPEKASFAPLRDFCYMFCDIVRLSAEGFMMSDMTMNALDFLVQLAAGALSFWYAAKFLRADFESRRWTAIG